MVFFGVCINRGDTSAIFKVYSPSKEKESIQGLTTDAASVEKHLPSILRKPRKPMNPKIRMSKHLDITKTVWQKKLHLP